MIESCLQQFGPLALSRRQSAATSATASARRRGLEAPSLSLMVTLLIARSASATVACVMGRMRTSSWIQLQSSAQLLQAA
jgi:hypothetical protein